MADTPTPKELAEQVALAEELVAEVIAEVERADTPTPTAQDADVLALEVASVAHALTEGCNPLVASIRLNFAVLAYDDSKRAAAGVLSAGAQQ